MSARLRDLFFALSTGDAPGDTVADYRAEVDATDTEPATALDGLPVSWHPTARFKAVRFVDAERIDPEVRADFARPSESAPHLAAVFVDPRELSFRTFENIVPLDRWFAGAPLELALSEPVELTKDAYTSRLQLLAADRARLEGLDELNLYVPPLNAATRGGERFIFHSARLAEALTKAVTEALPEPLLDGFSHVNPVFRCNRFEPGDARFHRHRDTPYYDAARGHVSRYTVLLYLTGGSGEPALDLVGGTAVEDIEEFTCVVFDQRYEHEGAPFRDGRKVFLRTELIFGEAEVTHDPGIGALFSKACYLTGESLFTPELARHADACYDRVAAAHWDGLSGDKAQQPYLHKQFRGVDFVANGHDFWFARSEGLSVAECAAITLLDYFNCKIGDAAFRDRCETQVIEAADEAWIPDFLKARARARASAEGPAVAPFDKSQLFPASEEANGACCPFHDWGRFDPTRFDEIIDLHERAQNFAKAHIMPAPILMLGQDVVLDPEKFVIHGNQIHVLGKESLAPVNFAACWNSGGIPANYLDVAATVGAAHFLVPPILFSESQGCYHLRFDFFRNTWTVKHKQSTVPVPRIRDLTDPGFDPDADDYDYDYDEDEGAGEGRDRSEAYPWMDAVGSSLVVGGSGTKDTPWWADESPLVDELYDHVSEREGDDDEDDEDHDDPADTEQAGGAGQAAEVTAR